MTAMKRKLVEVISIKHRRFLEGRVIYITLMNGFVRLKMKKVLRRSNKVVVFRSHALSCCLSNPRQSLSHSYSSMGKGK